MFKIKLAKKKAIQSSCRYKISALGFDKKGNYLGAATNQRRFTRKGGGLHAEMLLLIKYKQLLDKVLLCRVGNAGDFLPIKPCKNCEKILKKYDIKWYSIKG